jgi:hypothetical protein
MPDNFQSSKVIASELSSAAKFDNFVQAVEDAINSLDDSNIAVAANILVSKLLAGADGEILKTVGGVPTWAVEAAAGVVNYATTLPGSPGNGDETILVDSLASPTFSWRLRFNSTLAMWEYIGGRAAFSEVTTAETTSSSTYVALATAGPSIVLPVAGDYEVTIGAHMEISAQSAPRMSYDIGGTGAVDADAIGGQMDAGSRRYAYSKTRVKVGLGAVTLTAKYRTSANTGTFLDRWMRVTPVKLS